MLLLVVIRIVVYIYIACFILAWSPYLFPSMDYQRRAAILWQHPIPIYGALVVGTAFSRATLARCASLCRPSKLLWPFRRGGQAALTRRVSADPWRTRLVRKGPPLPFCLGTGEGFTSPRSIRSRDGGRGSPSAESLSSLAGEDGDSRRNTSLGHRSQDGGRGARLAAGAHTAPSRTSC